MKKLQASMRDRAAKKYRSEGLHFYRVGSYFKGCHHCGDVEWVERGDRLVKVYSSGYDVFRSYDPQWLGWTWWCWTCGAKDLDCWEPDMGGMVEAQLGKPPIMGSRKVKIKLRKDLRKLLLKQELKDQLEIQEWRPLEKAKTVVEGVRNDERSRELSDIKKKLQELLDMYKSK